MNVLQELLVPQESVNDQTLTVVGLNFKTGDFVKKDDVLIELETSKAIVTLEANADGYIIYHCKINDEVLLNTLIIQIVDKIEDGLNIVKSITDQNPSLINVPDEISPSSIAYDTQFSKKALALIEKNNLSKTIFKAYDFVSEELILNYLNPGFVKVSPESTFSKKSDKVFTEPNKKDLSSKVTFEKLTAAKRREIEYLSAVQTHGLVSTLYVDINTTGIIESVSNQLTYFKNSLLPLVIFESSKLLLKYPLLNAYYDNGQVGKYKDINVGFAIDIDDGLKVIKIPNTSALSILDLEQNIFKLSNKYLDKKLEVADFTDITFTVTDLSSTDVYFFAPLINKDNSAILGISKINTRSGQCILSLSFDHRVTSGKYAGSFLTDLKHRIESFAIDNKKPIVDMVCYKCLKNISEDYNDVGFIKVQTKHGEEKLLCDTCLMY